MKKKIVIIASLCCVVLLGSIISVFATDKQKELDLESNGKVRIIDTEGIVTSDEYTLLDIIIENTDKDKIKPQKKWWEKTPKNEQEKAIIESFKVEREYLKQLASLEKLIEEKKLKNEDTKSLEDQHSQLMEIWLKQNAETVKLMGEEDHINN